MPEVRHNWAASLVSKTSDTKFWSDSAAFIMLWFISCVLQLRHTQPINPLGRLFLVRKNREFVPMALCHKKTIFAMCLCWPFIPVHINKPTCSGAEWNGTFARKSHFPIILKITASGVGIDRQALMQGLLSHSHPKPPACIASPLNHSLIGSLHWIDVNK